MAWLKRIKWVSAGVVAVAVCGLAGAIAFDTVTPPAPMSSISAPFANVDFGDMPKPARYQARDGAALSYRLYKGGDSKIVVLIHGSSGESSGMHALARALAAGGSTVYAPDLRGHGEDGRLGDIDYSGQLDDDLADLMREIRREHATAPVDLVGHSSGGGFVLRVAEGPGGAMFARFFVLAPALHYGAPTWRPGAGGWARAAVPRIVGLMILDRFGITAFQHLPVVAFAVSPTAKVRLASTYSFVMQRNFGAPPDDLANLARVSAPLTFLLAANDEIFYADRYTGLIAPRRPGTPVQIVPDVDHMGLIAKPAGIAAIVAAMR